MNRAQDVFLISSALLLAVTGAAKLHSASGTAGILLMLDPIFNISNRVLMLLIGALEVFLAVYVLVQRKQIAPPFLIFWISANFMFYRFASDLLKVKLCPCLGNLNA